MADGHIENFRQFKSHVKRLNVEMACQLAVELFDSQALMTKAFDWLCLVFRHDVTAQFIKTRLEVHAKTVGYDNSEELVAALAA